LPVYKRKSRLSKARRQRLLEHFVAGTTARAAAELVDVNRNTVNRFYFAFRQIIAEEMGKATSLALKGGRIGSRRRVKERLLRRLAQGANEVGGRKEGAGVRLAKAWWAGLHPADP